MRRPYIGLAALLVALLVTAVACGEAPPPQDEAAPPGPERAETQEAFWSHLEALCGQAFSGAVAEQEAVEDDFQDRELIMHVRECDPDEIRIPLHVGEDRSRTWVITRTAQGLRLKHDHRHEDGTEEELTQYGGDTEEPGTEGHQDFHADQFTAELLPEAATNVWTLEVEPGESFAYQLVREGTDRRVRFEFDLSETVPAPPAPWGFEDEG